MGEIVDISGRINKSRTKHGKPDGRKHINVLSCIGEDELAGVISRGLED